MKRRVIKFLGCIIGILTIVITIFITKVEADMQDIINERIAVAQKELQASEHELFIRDPHLFSIYRNSPLDSEGHGAEIKLRMLYPIEYKRYIDAKINLDDLMYTKFLMLVNRDEKEA